MPCCSHQISGLVSLPSADCNLLAAPMAADLMRLDNCVKARIAQPWIRFFGESTSMQKIPSICHRHAFIGHVPEAVCSVTVSRLHGAGCVSDKAMTMIIIKINIVSYFLYKLALDCSTSATALRKQSMQIVAVRLS